MAADKLLTPFERIIRMPQLMFVRHDPNLMSTMNRFRKASQQSRNEKKTKEFERLNGHLKR